MEKNINLINTPLMVIDRQKLMDNLMVGNSMFFGFFLTDWRKKSRAEDTPVYYTDIMEARPTSRTILEDGKVKVNVVVKLTSPDSQYMKKPVKDSRLSITLDKHDTDGLKSFLKNALADKYIEFMKTLTWPGDPDTWGKKGYADVARLEYYIPCTAYAYGEMSKEAEDYIEKAYDIYQHMRDSSGNIVFPTPAEPVDVYEWDIEGENEKKIDRQVCRVFNMYKKSLDEPMGFLKFKKQVWTEDGKVMEVQFETCGLGGSGLKVRGKVEGQPDRVSSPLSGYDGWTDEDIKDIIREIIVAPGRHWDKSFLEDSEEGQKLNVIADKVREANENGKEELPLDLYANCENGENAFETLCEENIDTLRKLSGVKNLIIRYNGKDPDRKCMFSMAWGWNPGISYPELREQWREERMVKKYTALTSPYEDVWDENNKDHTLGDELDRLAKDIVDNFDEYESIWREITLTADYPDRTEHSIDELPVMFLDNNPDFAYAYSEEDRWYFIIWKLEDGEYRIELRPEDNWGIDSAHFTREEVNEEFIKALCHDLFKKAMECAYDEGYNYQVDLRGMYREMKDSIEQDSKDHIATICDFLKYGLYKKYQPEFEKALGTEIKERYTGWGCKLFIED